MIVRAAHAHEGEVVRIRWTLADGGFFDQDVSIPPAETRKARRGEGAETPKIPNDFDENNS